MLSLLARLVVGEDRDESDFDVDTDEEVLVPPAMPEINIDQTELGQDALATQEPESCRSPVSDSSEDPTEKEETLQELPEPEVCRRVLELVEYYLSEHNLVKDMFMLKHVTKHREGYVSLKLLATYKKVKHLTRDWRVVAHALKDSQALELNPEGTKVRRRHALPQEMDEDTRPFRTLLAVDVSRELANMNALAEFFGKFGEMVSLQMHKPGGRALDEVRQAERDNPDISGKVCALVEFEKVHHARQALRAVVNGPECGLRVLEVSRKKRDCGGGYGSSLLHIKSQTEGESAYYSNSDFSEPPSPVCRVRSFPRCRTPFSPSPSPKTGRRGRGGQQQQQSSPESSPPSPFSPRHRVPTPSSSPEERPADFYPRFTSPSSSPLPRRRPSPCFQPIPDSPFLGRHRMTSPAAGAAQDREVATSPQLSPWLRRRVLSGSSTPLASPLSSPNLRRRHEASIILPSNVIRLPRGPDGSNGFLPRRTLVSVQS